MFQSLGSGRLAHVAAHVVKDIRMRSYGIQMLAEHMDGRQSFIENVILRTVPADDYTTPVPTALNISYEMAQSLMDALWNAGLRPSTQDDSVGALGATKEHLADMKELLWHKMVLPNAKT